MRTFSLSGTSHSGAQAIPSPWPFESRCVVKLPALPHMPPYTRDCSDHVSVLLNAKVLAIESAGSSRRAGSRAIYSIRTWSMTRGQVHIHRMNGSLSIHNTIQQLALTMSQVPANCGHITLKRTRTDVSRRSIVE